MRQYGMGEARAIVRLVLETRFGLKWADVLCGLDKALDESKREELEAVIQRLEEGGPVQYVLGEAEFCGRKFAVASGVLIPRPETEELVRLAVDSQQFAKTSAQSPFMVLDIGTGSGCIALTLALERPDWQVEGWDISSPALTIAQQNARRFGIGNVTFHKADILKKAEEIVGGHLPTIRYQLIISNPPYVCESEKVEMEANVLGHEPAEALFVPDSNPLLYYRAIALFASQALFPSGTLLLEINRKYGTEVMEMLKNHGFNECFVRQDQFGNDRFVGAKRPDA